MYTVFIQPPSLHLNNLFYMSHRKDSVTSETPPPTPTPTIPPTSKKKKKKKKEEKKKRRKDPSLSKDSIFIFSHFMSFDDYYLLLSSFLIAFLYPHIYV